MTLVEKGEPAPFTGDLYPVKDSVNFAMAIEACTKRTAAEITHAKRLFQIELGKEKDIATSAAIANQERLDLLQAQLDEANRWYREPVFVATVTAVTTVAGLLVTAILVQSTAEVRR